MSADAEAWLRFASENLDAAKVCLDSALLNPCLHNTQQAVEKALKALLLLHAREMPRRTHSITWLHNALEARGIADGLDPESCSLLDAVYMPSKYPLGSVLPDFQPDITIATRCVAIAQNVVDLARADIARERS